MLPSTLPRPSFLPAVCAMLLATAPARADNLVIFLLLGQSNMEGQAYTYDNPSTAGWNIPTMEFLLSGTPAASRYLRNLPFEFKTGFDSSWLSPREDVWCVQYNSTNGSTRDVLPTTNSADTVNGIAPLSPGFGVNTNFGSMIGAELAMGIRLGDALDSPLFLFKSNMGGTTLGNDWRPPAAVAKRGGTVGPHFTNTITKFRAFLDSLDADLAVDGLLNTYNNATGYEIAGVFWLQGWNEKFDDAPYSASQLQAEYADNLKDLIYSIRTADPRLPADLGLIVGESSDQDPVLNAARLSAVADLNAEIPDSAAYFDTDNMIGSNWGNNSLGVPFSTNWGYHFHARAEHFLEIGWKAAGAALENGFVTEGPLRFGAPGVASLAHDQASVSVHLNAAVDDLLVGWGVADHGKNSMADWPHSLDLGGWTGPPTEIHQTLSNLAENTTYVFRFFARSDALAAQAWSGLGTFTTPFENPPPLLGPPASSAPTTDGATLTCELSRAAASETHLVWAFSDQGEVDPAAWSSSPGGGALALGPASAGETLSHALTGLASQADYVVRFIATNPFGSSWSQALALRTARDMGDWGLTAYYDFEADGDPYNDPAGAFADDLAGRFNPALSPDVSPGAKGSAQSAIFNGNSALFTDAYTTDLGPDPGAYTIMFWVKGADAGQESDNTRLMTTRLRPDGAASSTPAWQIEGFGNSGSNGDAMDLRMNDPLPGNWFSPDAVNALANSGETPQWRHVAFVVANSNHPDLSGNAFSRTFVDGVQTGLEAETPWNGLALGNTDGQLIIGGHAESAGSRAFTGLLDEVALFAGIVPDAEIEAIATGARSPADFLTRDEAPLRLAITANGSDLVFTWNFQPGRRYTLRSSADLSLTPSTWPLFLEDVSSPLVIPRPATAQSYFIVEGVPVP